LYNCDEETYGLLDRGGNRLAFGSPGGFRPKRIEQDHTVVRDNGWPVEPRPSLEHTGPTRNARLFQDAPPASHGCGVSGFRQLARGSVWLEALRRATHLHHHHHGGTERRAGAPPSRWSHYQARRTDKNGTSAPVVEQNNQRPAAGDRPALARRSQLDHGCARPGHGGGHRCCPGASQPKDLSGPHQHYQCLGCFQPISTRYRRARVGELETIMVFLHGQLCCWQTPRRHRTLPARSTGKATEGWGCGNNQRASIP
jgi:hypothetical protein